MYVTCTHTLTSFPPSLPPFHPSLSASISTVVRSHDQPAKESDWWKNEKRIKFILTYILCDVMIILLYKIIIIMKLKIKLI